MWIDRIARPIVLKRAQQFPVLLLTGARQTGKTSLFRRLFPEHQYVTLDDPRQMDWAVQQPDDFLNRFDGPVIIDEVQYAPELFRHLKIKADESPEKGHYLLTGSQTFRLMQGVSESLAGRVGILQLPTLSALEIRSQLPEITHTELMFRGGYPAIHSVVDMDPEAWFPSYVATFIERDVRNLLQIRDLRDFSRFLRALAARAAQLLSLSDLSRDVGVAVNTIKSWLSVLEASGIVTVLEPYFRNLTRRMVKTPKVYFNDTGLLVHLLGIRRREDLTHSALIGNIWENHCFCQLAHAFRNAGHARPPLWFLRTPDGREVDFIIDRGGSFTALEAKFKETFDDNDLRGFRSLENWVGSEAVSGRILLAPVSRPVPQAGGVFTHDAVDLTVLVR